MAIKSFGLISHTTKIIDRNVKKLLFEHLDQDSTNPLKPKVPQIMKSFDQIERKTAQDYINPGDDIDSDSSGNHSAGDEATRVGEMYNGTDNELE